MRLCFEGIENIRDLGGTRVSGGVVKDGVLLRAARLSAATDEDVAALCAMGLRHIIDFRELAECRKNPDRPVPGAQYHHFSALRPMTGRISARIRSLDAAAIGERFKSIYRYMAQGRNAARAYTDFFEVLSISTGAVLFHCTQGKDRTGIAAMLLLTALGADEETIREEYFLSNIALQKNFDKMRESGADAARLAAAEQYLFVREETVNVYFETMREEHGGMTGYLRDIVGLRDEDFVRLREKYVIAD